jgi:hypothetical protein
VRAKTWLYGRVSERMRLRVRRFGRLRWMTKARVVRKAGASPVRWWRFVLTSPEVDSFSYRLTNEDELAEMLAAAVGRPQGELADYLAEVDVDPILRRAVRQPWWRWWWSARQLTPNGYHRACWAVLRATRPSTAVETGILDGIGSTVMLAALERNAVQGSPGQLISFDIMPGAGALVPTFLRPRWRQVYDDALTELDPALTGHEVGFFASDSLKDPEHIRAELNAVLRHRAELLIAMTAWGGLSDLGWPGGRVARFRERPANHFYGGNTIAISRQ